MKAAEIRVLSTAEITNKLADTRQELMNLRFQLVTGQLTYARQLIARLESILREREITAQLEGEE